MDKIIGMEINNTKNSTNGIDTLFIIDSIFVFSVCLIFGFIYLILFVVFLFNCVTKYFLCHRKFLKETKEGKMTINNGLNSCCNFLKYQTIFLIVIIQLVFIVSFFSNHILKIFSENVIVYGIEFFWGAVTKNTFNILSFTLFAFVYDLFNYKLLKSIFGTLVNTEQKGCNIKKIFYYTCLVFIIIRSFFYFIFFILYEIQYIVYIITLYLIPTIPTYVTTIIIAINGFLYLVLLFLDFFTSFVLVSVLMYHFLKTMKHMDIRNKRRKVFSLIKMIFFMILTIFIMITNIICLIFYLFDKIIFLYLSDIAQFFYLLIILLFIISAEFMFQNLKLFGSDNLEKMKSRLSIFFSKLFFLRTV